MSASVKLSSKLPGDGEINGLDAYASRLLEDPQELLPCFVLLDVGTEILNIDAGTRVPVARIRRIEPLGDTLTDVPQAVRDCVAAAEESRTGRKAIPFGMVEVTEAAWGDPLPTSDELAADLEQGIEAGIS